MTLSASVVLVLHFAAQGAWLGAARGWPAFRAAIFDSIRCLVTGLSARLQQLPITLSCWPCACFHQHALACALCPGAQPAQNLDKSVCGAQVFVHR